MFRIFISLVLFSSAAQAQESLEDRVKELERRLAQSPAGSQNPATALNPTLTVIGNMLWRLDDGRVHLEGDPLEPRVDDSFNVREVELDMRAAIDPHADGVAILAIESEVAGEFAVAIEEFYAVIKTLPFGFWQDPPLATRIKVGRFRVDFGRINKLHLHDLPQSMYGLVINDFLGEEGYIANGAQITSSLGSVGEAGALTLNLNALEGGGAAIADDVDVPNILMNLQLYMEFGDANTIDVGLYVHYGGVEGGAHQRHSRTISLDAMYKWKPKKQGEWTSFVAGFQVFKGDRSFVLEEDVDADGITDFLKGETSQPMGWLIWAQYQLDRRWYVGLRHDQSEFITNDEMNHSRTSPYVSCYLSEFFRIRVSFEFTTSDLVTEDELRTFLLELNVIFGAHPPHPFWVNK